MNAYEVRVTEAHAISLSNLRSYDTYVGEIVRTATGEVAYRTKHYIDPKTARLQAGRLRRNYEYHLTKYGVGFEQQEAERKANERTAREAKRAADRRVRDAAPDLLAALEAIFEGAGMTGENMDAARAAITKAREG